MGRARPPVARSRPPVHRRFLASPRSFARWAVVASISLLLATVVASSLSEARRERARWGDRVPVVVTTRAVAVGAPFDGAIAVVEWPAGLAPEGALRSVDDLEAGGVASSDRGRGEPVTELAVVAPGDSDRPLVAVPTLGARPDVAVGDRVSVWATYDPSLAGGGASTRQVAEGATVASVTDDAVVVAVESDRVGAVVEATALATVTIVSERR